MTENLDRLDVMMSMGAMPESIPAGIRKAALRGQVLTLPKDGSKPEDEDEGPYFSVKYVLVEEGGQLKVGYFEFVPPNLFD